MNNSHICHALYILLLITLLVCGQSVTAQNRNTPNLSHMAIASSDGNHMAKGASDVMRLRAHEANGSGVFWWRMLLSLFTSFSLGIGTNHLFASWQSRRQGSQENSKTEAPKVHVADTNVSVADQRFIQKLQELVIAKIDEPSLNRDVLAEAANLSASQLYCKLKTITGHTPSVFIRKIRLQKSIELIQSELMSISEIAYTVGFNDPNYFSRVFRAEFGKPPIAYRRKGTLK